MSKPVMVCIGKVGQDTFLEGEVFKPLKEKGVFYEHIKLGEKFYVDNATFSPGGNAANASVTFARQHLETYFISSVGKDITGDAILKALDAEHVNTSAVITDPNARTSFSTILLSPTGERTILDYPGTAQLTNDVAEIEAMKADWLYVSSVGSMPLLKKIMQVAHKNGTQVAFNPSSFELKHVQACADLLQYTTLLALNKEEAQLFIGADRLGDLAKKLAESVEYVLVSDGPRGSVACDGVQLVKAGMYDDVPVIDRTGAGDAFTSGFVSQIARGKNLTDAIVFASANSTSVVTKIGAQTGILRGAVHLHEMPLKVMDI